jgi:hypothetical protein
MKIDNDNGFHSTLTVTLAEHSLVEGFSDVYDTKTTTTVLDLYDGPVATWSQVLLNLANFVMTSCGYIVSYERKLDVLDRIEKVLEEEHKEYLKERFGIDLDETEVDDPPGFSDWCDEEEEDVEDFTVNWDDIPKEFNWVGVDDDGAVWAYEAEPEWDEFSDEYLDYSDSGDVFKVGSGAQRHSGTLVKRPS